MNDDIFTQVFGVIRDQANSGAQATGDVADWLIRAGLSVAAIRQILNGVATSAAATPGQVDYVQSEMRYLQDSYASQQSQSSFVFLLVAAGLLYAATRD